MKKTLLRLLLLFALPMMATAGQSGQSAQQDRAVVNPNILSGVPAQPGNTVDALFDLQFDYQLTRAGFAGITWTYGSYWISKYSNDSMFTVNPATGAITSYFTIPGLTGVRGMTFDGTNVWAVNYTMNIYKIDTATKTIVSQYQIAPDSVRGIAYDSAAHAFWLSDFNADIVLVDTNGVTLNTILQSNHGLGGIYNIAYDPYTTGGPYIWAFDQGGNGQQLVRIPVDSGIPDLSHNVDFEVPGDGIAGGVAITGFGGSPHSIIGISQAQPQNHLFGYELNDYIPPPIDASLDSIIFYPENTKQPAFMLSSINWVLPCRNTGTNSLDTLGVDITVDDGSTTIYSESASVLNVASATSTSVSVPGPFNPSATPANYTITATINTHSQVDTHPENDTLSYDYSVTDTVMARYGRRAGSIGLTDHSEGTVAQIFDLQNIGYATSITLTFANPTAGDSIYGEIYDWDGSSGQPSNLVARTTGYTITAADTNGFTVTLPVQGGPYMLTPAYYAVGVHQFDNNVSIRYSTFNYRPNTCWILFASSGTWAPAENTGSFKIVPFVDLNIWSQTMISVAELKNSVLSIYPNPSSGTVNIENPLTEKCTFTITDMQGKIVYTEIFEGKQKEVIRTSEWSNGIYIAKAEANGVSSVSKLVIQ